MVNWNENGHVSTLIPFCFNDSLERPLMAAVFHSTCRNCDYVIACLVRQLMLSLRWRQQDVVLSDVILSRAVVGSRVCIANDTTSANTKYRLKFAIEVLKCQVHNRYCLCYNPSRTVMWWLLLFQFVGSTATQMTI